MGRLLQFLLMERTARLHLRDEKNLGKFFNFNLYFCFGGLCWWEGCTERVCRCVCTYGGSEASEKESASSPGDQTKSHRTVKLFFFSFFCLRLFDDGHDDQHQSLSLSISLALLSLPHVPVVPALDGHERVVRASLCDDPLSQDDDLVAVHDGAEPVGDDESALAL